MVTTERAKHFYSPQDIPVTLYSDADEWEVSVGGPRAEFRRVSTNGTGVSSLQFIVLVARADRLGSSQWSGPSGQRR